MAEWWLPLKTAVVVLLRWCQKRYPKLKILATTPNEVVQGHYSLMMHHWNKLANNSVYKSVSEWASEMVGALAGHSH